MAKSIAAWITESQLPSEAGLEAAAEARLGHSAYLELRSIRCSAGARMLRLQGQVSSYYLRQIAQTIVQGLEGVDAVENQLQVVPRVYSRRPLV